MASPEELAAIIARKRGTTQAPVEGTPAPSTEQRPTMLQALGRGAAASFVPALKETGAAAGRMLVPGYSTYETMTSSPAGLPLVFSMGWLHSMTYWRFYPRLAQYAIFVKSPLKARLRPA